MLLITLRDSSFRRSIYVFGLKYECFVFHIIFCAENSKLDAVAVRCRRVCRILLYSTQSESLTCFLIETMCVLSCPHQIAVDVASTV
jgi:hypothetical protein